MINLHQIEVFVAVVEEASFRRAASRLYLTQPAVSAQIRHLRGRFGIPLIARDGRRVVPTEAGAALYRYARQVVAMTDSLTREVAEISSGALERIVVGGNHTYGVYVLPEVIAGFRANNPAVAVSVVDGSNSELIDQVRSGHIDAAVVSGPRVPRDLTVARLGIDEPIVIDSAEHPVTHAPSLSLEELSGLPVVRTAIDREGGKDALDQLLVNEGLDPCRTAMEITTWEGVKAAVRLGVGLALVLHASVRSELAQGSLRVVSVEGFRSPRNVSLLCTPRRQAVAPPVFQQLVASLTREVPLAFNANIGR